MKNGSDRDAMLMWLRPSKVRGVLRPHCDEYKAGAELCNPEVSGLKQLPVSNIPKLRQTIEDPLSVTGKARRRQPTDIFEEEGTGLNDCNLLNRPCKEVALVRGPQLLAGDRERRAWNSPCQEVYAFVVRWAPDGRIRHITDCDLAVRVLLEGPCSCFIKFDGKDVVEPRAV